MYGKLNKYARLFSIIPCTQRVYACFGTASHRFSRAQRYVVNTLRVGPVTGEPDKNKTMKSLRWVYNLLEKSFLRVR